MEEKFDGRILFSDNSGFLRGMHLVSIDRITDDKQVLVLLIMFDAGYFLRMSLAYMLFVIAQKEVMVLAVDSTPMSMSSNREMQRTQCFGKQPWLWNMDDANHENEHMIHANK